MTSLSRLAFILLAKGADVFIHGTPIITHALILYSKKSKCLEYSTTWPQFLLARELTSELE